MKCINCNNAGKCLDHREIPDLAGCTSGIPDRKAKTNADRIRNMTDEELAEWLHNISQDYDDEQEPIVSIYSLDAEKEEFIHDSYGDLLKWLQSEVEEYK